MAQKLNRDTLDQLPKNIPVPLYGADDITPGIVHIGVGNFHRAHQAIYLNRLFNRGMDRDWGIIGAGVMPGDARMRDQLQHQDWLSTVVELDPNGYTAQISGAMIGFAEVNIPALVHAMTQPEIRIVSLTVTEGGYYVDPQTGGFNVDHPIVKDDARNPDKPKTVFGAIVIALRKRKAKGLEPFTVMSCDNVPENGKVAKQAVLGLATLIAPDLVTWIDDNVAFPNSMVDCITPATGDRERNLVTERFGIDDPTVVVCEPFRQWVLEDNFPQGRPRLEDVGVEFVDDVASYELMKLRILNGGHAAIAYPSALMGLEYAHDAMQSDVVRAYLDKLEHEEIIPTVPNVPNVDFNHYLSQTMDRFSNTEIEDTIPRLCLDGSNRQPKFILPTIVDRLNDGLSVKGLALEVALWCRYCAGSDDKGQPLIVEDEKAACLQANARQAQSNPQAFLGMTDIFGPIATNDNFAKEFSAALSSLWENGTALTLANYVSGDAS